MRHRAYATALGTLCVVAAAAMGQAPGNPQAGSSIQATVETAPLNLILPDRYAVPVVLEPNRMVFLMAPNDGMLKSVSTPVGTLVRENQEIAQLDRMEAAARVKIAEAEVKEAQANAATESGAVTQARLDAAKARAELAQIELDRCTLRAPFGGKILAAPVPAGQYVSKGNTLAELADFSIMKVLVPVDRTIVKVGAELELFVEGKPISGQVLAMVPLPESFGLLRELAIPWAAAWVSINNGSGTLEPGQRVRGPFTPMQPITALPARALRSVDGDSATVQVNRTGLVLDIPVKILGDAGFERTQVAGPFSLSDEAIVETSVPMIAGTTIRFSDGGAVSGADVGSTGRLTVATPPVGGPVTAGTGRGIAPIGSPDVNVPKATAKSPARSTTPNRGAQSPPKAAPAKPKANPF